MDEIELLKEAKDKAWREFDKLVGPHNAAWKKYEAAKEALREAEIYAKAKRKVMRDLIQQAGKADKD